MVLTSLRWNSVPELCFFSSSNIYRRNNGDKDVSFLTKLKRTGYFTCCNFRQTSNKRIEGPPSCIFSIIMLRVAVNTLSLLILSLAEIPVVMRSMSIVPTSLGGFKETHQTGFVYVAMS